MPIRIDTCNRSSSRAGIRSGMVVMLMGCLAMGAAGEASGSNDAFMKTWLPRYGKAQDIDAWRKDNPTPWNNYFKKDDKECAAQWFVNLGPLGVRTYLHDMTWSEFPAFKERFPRALVDQAGLVVNAIEVIAVDPQGPAAGVLEKGDLIVQIDGVALLSAQETYQDREVLERNTRSLEIHAGQLIDAAEGQGRIRLQVLRLSEQDRAKTFEHPPKVANQPRRLAPTLIKQLKVSELQLPRIGSFGKKFDPEGEKSRNYRAMLAHRIAAQQAANGSWSGVSSYTHPAFHTAMCGLGLLAQADFQYDSHIRAAARYVADSSPEMVGGWSYPQGTVILFLSEYYLRTQDATILPALERAVVGVRPNITQDYVSGHVLHPGYGGAGWIGGGGMIACGLAVAARTPVRMAEPDLVDRMLSRIQELAPDGRMPYGRDHVRREPIDATLSAVKDNKGQGWSAGTGPYFLAALVRGGTDYFVKAVQKRYANPPWGDADGGHATHMIPFVWASLGIANCGAEAHRGNMEAFLWKFTLNRDFNGFINRNGNRLEYHGAEDVIGNPYWGMGGYLIILNAHRKNLAITGDPRFVAKVYRRLTHVHDSDKAFWEHLNRNWSMASAVLGKQTPSALTTALKNLRGLPMDTQLGQATFALLNQHGPLVARQISTLKDPTLGSPQRQFLMELMLAVDIEVSLGRRYREGAKPGDEQQIRIEIVTPFRRWQQALPEATRKTNPAPASDIVGSVTLRDPASRLLPTPFTFAFTPDKHTVNATMSSSPWAANLPLVAVVTYQAGDLTISYERPLIVNSDDPMKEFINRRTVSVTGQLDRDYLSWSLPLRLSDGEIIECADREGCDMNWREPGRSYLKSKRGFLLKGTPCTMRLSSGDRWEAFVHELTINDPAWGLLIPTRLSLANGNVTGGSLAPITDRDWDTTVKLAPTGNHPIALEWEFSKPVTASSVELRLKQEVPYELEVMVNGKWEFWGQGRTNPHRPLLLLASRSAAKFRLVLRAEPSRTLEMSELSLNGEPAGKP